MFDGVFVTTSSALGGVLNGIVWCVLILCAIKCCKALCRPRWREE